MGEKYELNFLSNKDNGAILICILSVLESKGWSYNVMKLGKYSYWKTGPIWKFGDSSEINEKAVDKSNNTTRIRGIVTDISQYYSQSIFYNKMIKDMVSTVGISIVESEGGWKEVSVAFELNEIISTLHEIKEIFVESSKCLHPYYAVAAIEMRGLECEPSKLIISEEMLGYFNYFSDNIINDSFLKSIENQYTFEKTDQLGTFIFNKSLVF